MEKDAELRMTLHFLRENKTALKRVETLMPLSRIINVNC